MIGAGHQLVAIRRTVLTSTAATFDGKYVDLYGVPPIKSRERASPSPSPSPLPRP